MFRHPFTCMVAGPTQSGKTYFTMKLLENLSSMVTPLPKRVIWCYGQYHDGLNSLPDFVEISEGLSALEEEGDGALVILDDLMYEAGEAKEVANLFTRGSHHRNMSVIMIVQNIFHQGKVMRSISLNTHYMVLFKNPRDVGQIKYLASQLFPGKIKFLEDAYKQATANPHGYLLLDFTQTTSDHERVSSGVLPGEEGYYYVPK